jgi:hypothetical protein
VADIVIDLGELPHGRQRRVRTTSRRRPHPYRALVTGAAVLLTAMLTGAVHVTSPPAPTVIPARLGDSTFADDGHYFVVSSSDGLVGRVVQKKTISMYALPSGALLSRTSVAVTGAVNRVTAAGDVILVSYQVDAVGEEVTVALAAGTDLALWRRPARLVNLSASGRIVLFNGLNPAYGGTLWYGVDLRSGETRWSLDQPVTGATDLVPGYGATPARLVTATVAGEVEVRDPETGRVTASATVPAPPEWRLRGLNIWVDDNLVLLGGRDGTIAYDLDHLRERWRNDVDLTEVFILPVCGDAICLFGRFGGLRVLDAATGRQRWSAEQWALAQQVGSYMLASGNDRDTTQQPLVVLDPADGRERGTLGAWQPVGEARADGTVVGVRERLGDHRVWYALLDPADRSVQVLGAAEDVAGNCQVTTDVLVCRRRDASVGVWRLALP